MSARASLYLDMATATEDTEKDGGELLVDGDMEAAGVGAWAAWSGSSLTKDDDLVNGLRYMRVTQAGAGVYGAYQAVVVVGQRYRARGFVRSDGVQEPKIYQGGVAKFSGTTSTDWQYFDIVFVAVNDALFYLYVADNGGVYADYALLSCVATGQLLDDGACEMEGTAEWTAEPANSALTKPSSGVLRVAYGGSNFPGAKQTVLTAGRKYRVTMEARGDGTYYPYIGDAVANHWLGTSSTEWQKVDLTFTPAVGYIRFHSSAVAAGYAEFRNLDVRPVYSVTVDKSKFGRLCKRGDGFTAASMPSFKNPGMECDGTSDYLLAQNSAAALREDKMTVIMAVRPNFVIGNGTQYALYDNATKNRLFIQGNGQFYASVKGSDNFMTPTLSAWKNYGMNVIAFVVQRTGAVLRQIWINGELAHSGATAANLTDGDDTIYIGASSALASAWFKGVYEYFAVVPFLMTPVQIREVTTRLMSGGK